MKGIYPQGFGLPLKWKYYKYLTFCLKLQTLLALTTENPHYLEAIFRIAIVYYATSAYSNLQSSPS
jgi:hypothetical protein